MLATCYELTSYYDYTTHENTSNVFHFLWIKHAILKSP